MKRRFLRPILVSPVTAALVVLAGVSFSAPRLSFIEVRAFDVLLRWIPKPGLDPRIELIEIGEIAEPYQSLRLCAAPPEGCEIPRRAYAEAARRLKRWGAKTIVFDLMFSKPCPREDPQVARAFRQAGNVIVAATTKSIPGAVSLKAPVSPLVESVWGVGSPVAYQPNETVRTVPLVVRDRDTGHPFYALPVLALECFEGEPLTSIELEEGRKMRVAGRTVPLLDGERISLLPRNVGGEQDSATAAFDVEQGQNLWEIPQARTWNIALINWLGPPESVQPHMLYDVLAMNDEEGRRLFGGKAVIVGRRGWDVHWTALGAMSGPELQANALHTLLSGSFIYPLDWWMFLGLVALLAGSTSLVTSRVRASRAVIFVFLLTGGSIGTAFLLLAYRGIWLYWFSLSLSVLLAWGLTATAHSDRVVNLLHRLVPDFLGGARVGERELGEIQTREASILYSDIRNFTTISEQLGAERTLRLLSSYRAAVEGIIGRHGGTIAIMPGDAIMAVFWRDHRGVPPALCSVKAGLEMLDRLPTLARSWEEAEVSLHIGIGLNYGQVAMGFVGQQDLEASVIGDAVNVAARLESLTKQLPYPLILSESVQSRLGEAVRTVFLDEVTVRGRQAAIRVYTVEGYRREGVASGGESIPSTPEEAEEG